MRTAPIILFVYRRPKHTEETLAYLRRNALAKESKLYIYSGAPKDASVAKDVEAVRALIKNIDGFKQVQIIQEEKHAKPAGTIIRFTSEIVEKYGRVIVLEDDLISSPNMLSFMNEALEYYENNPKVFSISGYQFPFELPKTYRHDAYFSHRASSWCWATWADRWKQADWEVGDYLSFVNDKKAQKMFCEGGDDLPSMLDAQMTGKIDAWCIRWVYALFRRSGLCLYPRYSKVQNIGMDGSGVNCTDNNKYAVSFSSNDKESHFSFPNIAEVSDDIGLAFKKFNSMPLKTKVKMRVLKALGF